MSNNAAWDRCGFCRFIQGDTPDLFPVRLVINPRLMSRAHRRNIKLTVGQPGGRRTVRVHSPDTNGVRAGGECPGKDNILSTARRDVQNLGCWVIYERVGISPLGVVSHEPGSVCRQQTAIGSPMEILDLLTVRKEGI